MTSMRTFTELTFQPFWFFKVLFMSSVALVSVAYQNRATQQHQNIEEPLPVCCGATMQSQGIMHWLKSFICLLDYFDFIYGWNSNQICRRETA